MRELEGEEMIDDKKDGGYWTMPDGSGSVWISYEAVQEAFDLLWRVYWMKKEEVKAERAMVHLRIDIGPILKKAGMLEK